MTLADSSLEWQLLHLSSEVPTYRGPDRRRATAVSSAPSSAITLGVFLVLSHVVVATAAWQGSWSSVGRPGPTDWVTALVAALSVVAGGIYLLRSRLAGDASAMWVGASLVVYSAANIAFPGLVSSFATEGSGVQSVAQLLRPAGAFVVVALLVVAVASSAVDARITVGKVLATIIGVGAVGLVLASYSSGFRLLLGPAIDRVPTGATGTVGQVGVAVLWLVLAIGFLWPRRHEWKDGVAAPWVGVMLLGLAEARLTLALSVHGDPAWMLASQTARLFAVAAALVGGLLTLQQAFTTQRSTLLTSVAELGSQRARRCADLALAQERNHDLHAALLAIGTAAMTLERHHDKLGDAERTSLANAVAAEIDRLQQIVAGVEEMRSFAVGAVLNPVVVCVGSLGVEIDVDIPADLLAHGSPTHVAEVVQNLLENARRHAPGSKVDVRASTSDGRVIVRVEDRGPGVANHARQRIFDRGWQGALAVEGSGLGLHMAARLAREQGGDLRVEDRPGGGASFVFTLTAPKGTTPP